MDIDAFRQMVAKNPKGFLGRYGLGNKILQEGTNFEEAVEHLTVATQLDPTHVASHLGLGRALVSLGRKDEAKPILQAGIDAARSGRSNGGVDLVPEMQTLLAALFTRVRDETAWKPGEGRVARGEREDIASGYSLASSPVPLA
jgi:tetratricopeptide (TPR) repeat protein